MDKFDLIVRLMRQAMELRATASRAPYAGASALEPSAERKPNGQQEEQNEAHRLCVCGSRQAKSKRAIKRDRAHPSKGPGSRRVY